jgi:hypothetical protein
MFIEGAAQAELRMDSSQILPYFALALYEEDYDTAEKAIEYYKQFLAGYQSEDDLTAYAREHIAKLEDSVP